ncbi:MAG: alanine:cation symporter family protein [Clostridia bacterium]|nr:alanine:cation symporter family protein [Clostridia bacterium]
MKRKITGLGILLGSVLAAASASAEEGFLGAVADVNKAVNGVVWGVPALALLAFVGVLMTVLTKVFQVTHLGHWFKKTIGAVFKDKQVTTHTKDKSISQFQSLCTALAATVGTGNIVGVAGAILAGGPGAVFWMWIMAFLGMMTNYSENVLGIYYRRRNSKGEWSGGAMYYLRDGLGSRKNCKTLGKVLAGLFAFFCLVASFGIGNMTQVNSISGNLDAVFGIPTWVTGVVIMLLVGLVVVGGLKRIASVTEKIVPFMVILYMIGTITIFFINISHVGAVFTSIFKGAFAMESAAGGIVGYGIKKAVELGMKRGVFSNEAGLGSSVMVHSNSNVKEPVKQGMWGIFEVFADTIVVCTLTAFAILSSGLIDLSTGKAIQELDNATLVSSVFDKQFGFVGSAFIAVSIALFAFSTVLGWSHYGTKACEYLLGEKRTIPYRILFVLLVFGGATMGNNLAWDLADTFNGLMMIPNLIGVIVLSGEVAKITKNYVLRHLRGRKDIEPLYSAFPDIQQEQEAAPDTGADD